MKNIEVDILIIGAGPAGLAAASCCLQEGLDFVIVEQGELLADRKISNPVDVTSGIGGAGLFSDGKLSYYPSGKGLWDLPAEETLRKAYSWFHNLISDFSNNFPPYPERFFQAGENNLKKIEENLFSKEYFSYVMDESERSELLQRLIRPISHKILEKTKVLKILPHDNKYLIEVSKNNSTENNVVKYIAKQVIYCGGRLGPIKLKHLVPDLKFVYRKFEYGIRLEQSQKRFFLKDWPTVDSKLVLKSKKNGVEWRTFCCCRQGSILRGELDEKITISGTSIDNNDYSNVGFNVRITDLETFENLSPEVANLFNNGVPSFSESIDEFLVNGNHYGVELDLLLKEGLNDLKNRYDISNCNVHGPCLEGVAFYPWLSSKLETMHSGLFVAGDSTGLFRGLLASLLSGYYAAKSAIEKRVSTIEAVKTNVSINRSSISTLPLIFTAQSKKFFYSRDVVCEYVFNQGMLPINPFRIFDYFLGDRVPRDIIRQANNHLVRVCDELWVFGPIADGVLFEVIYAINMHKPIRFFSIGTKSSEIYPIERLTDIKFEAEVHSSRQKRETLLKEIEKAFRNYQPNRQLNLPFTF
jgi:uncharacterized FAD-dependent dehydrogenase